MFLTGILLGVVAASFLAVVAWTVARLGLSPMQALLYAPFKFAFRIDDRQVKVAREAGAPVIYVVTHRSRIDAALMLALLPEETLHILEEDAARAEWLTPWRSLARTIEFKAEHVFVSRRLVRVLKGKGRIAVYIRETVEPDTRDFRLFRAVSRIALQADARIVPIIVEGAQFLPSSLIEPKEAPRRALPRLRIGVLEPVSVADLAASGMTTPSNALFDRVAEVRAQTSQGGLGLFPAVRAAARRFGPHRDMLEDPVSGTLTYRELLIGARIFAGRFARITAPGETVGLLLPNSNGVAVALFGLMSAGRVAAMLNFTAGPATITSAVRTAVIRTVVSSRAFVEKARLDDVVAAAEAGGARLVWMEDLRGGITGFDKAVGAMLWKSPVARQTSSGPAVVMFTSGSDGAPKAVVLSQVNLVSNAMQVEARLRVGPGDHLMNVLPVFHAFGLTGGLILPLLAGVRTLLYPTPLHYKLIPQVAAKARPTILFATDTFLAAYAAAAKDPDFSSLRFAVAGAEPLRSETRRVWRERFGVRLLEGYGMTEASPVVALNTASHGRDGSVGRPVPGLKMRIEPVEGITEGGRLWIAGPNVMSGTISADRPGEVQAIGGGWHDTGDIVSLDREGYVTVRGRARRFAKIAGEMVSLATVEMLAAELWPEARHVVVCVPDPRRGERIVLLTTNQTAEAASLRRHAKAEGVAEIALPQDILAVEDVPILATGKTDHAAARRIALDRLGIAAAA